MNIYDIAREAGVSISTVSRVINNRGRVSPKTAEKVREVMRKHNYIPNQMARGLVGKSIQNIGIVSVDIRGSHYVKVAYSAINTFSEVGYSCFMSNAGKTPEEHEKNIDLLLQNKLDGLILIGSAFQNKLMKQKISRDLSHIPIVMVNGFLDLPNVYSVKCDAEEGIRMATEYLCSNGNQSIVFVRGHNLDVSDKEKEKGYLSVIEKYNLEPIVISSENKISQASIVTDDLLKNKKSIDAVIYASDTMATGGMKTLIQNQFDIPGDIEIIGYNNTEICEFLTPSLTSIDSQAEQLGIQAARNLFDAIEGRKVSKQLTLMPELIKRESTK